MGSTLNYFYLYEILDPGKAEYLLLRVIRPAYRNADQGAEDEAERVLDERKDALLKHAMDSEKIQQVRQAGVCTGSPEGDDLYEQGNGFPIRIWFARVSGYDGEYIVLNQAKDEAEFWGLVAEDSETNNLVVERPARSISARFYQDGSSEKSWFTV